MILWAAMVLACRVEPSPAPDPGPPPSSPDPAAPRAEATSLLGEPLYAPELPADVFAEREAKMVAAAAELDKDPTNVEAIIWYGRRLAYLGRYRDAIEIYAAGLERHPESAELYRHRGHRFITTRQFDKAVADLKRAAELIEGEPDVIEQDGLPNPAGIPTGTRRTNVYYHLGLAHYLRGEFEDALAAYRTCLEASTTDDMRVATSHWLWMTLRRLNRVPEAAAVLEPITADMTLYENFDYHRLLLMYRGEVDPHELIEKDADAIGSATLGYGLGNWHLVHGRKEDAKRAFEEAIGNDNWAAFGYIAAEADLARGL